MIPRVVSDPRQAGACWRFTGRERTGWRMDPHRHQEVEANLVRAGNATYVIGDRRFDLAPGDVLWLMPDDAHGVMAWSADVVFDILVFSRRLLASELPAGHALRQGGGAWPRLRRIGVTAARSLRSQADELFALTASPQAHGRALRAGLAWWLHRSWDAFSAGAERAAVALHPGVASAMLRWRDDPSLSLPECARAVGLSPARLSRLFAAGLGTGVADWRNRARLERFLDIAEDGREPTLLAAALAAGFGSYAQFHRVFTRRFGRPPGRWRDRGPA